MEKSVVRVIDARGEQATIEGTPTAAAGEIISIRLDSGEQVRIDARRIRPSGDGSYRLDGSFADLRTTGIHGGAGAVQEQIVPISEETLAVGKRVRETGRVLIHKHVHERTEVVDEPLLHEEVEVERVQVNRVLTAAPEIRYEGDTMVIPVVEERYVVQKQLVLKEELRVVRRRSERHAPQEVTLRSESVEVERIPAERAAEAPGAGTLER